MIVNKVQQVQVIVYLVLVIPKVYYELNVIFSVFNKNIFHY